MTRPITILIGALGGEGGGVLTDWIVTAATDLGFPVQSTSIPGVRSGRMRNRASCSTSMRSRKPTAP
jgi:Pyruvate/2-oxoacid:ferredoxin oxidoreductase gamma subunit